MYRKRKHYEMIPNDQSNRYQKKHRKTMILKQTWQKANDATTYYGFANWCLFLSFKYLLYYHLFFKNIQLFWICSVKRNFPFLNEIGKYQVWRGLVLTEAYQITYIRISLFLKLYSKKYGSVVMIKLTSSWLHLMLKEIPH